MGKLSIGMVKFHNHGMVQAVIVFPRNVRLSRLLMSFLSVDVITACSSYAYFILKSPQQSGGFTRRCCPSVCLSVCSFIRSYVAAAASKGVPYVSSREKLPVKFMVAMGACWWRR